MPVNIQYAIGIFQALNEFGLNYVVDPSSAFEDNVGTSSIDFLQFPYQTLMYRGGDCDDLSILVCSLFEAVGIDTAFITVPGHIFMAFDSGLTPDQAKIVFKNRSEYIVDDGKVWMPLEITLSDEGFYRACRYGAREWNAAEARGAAALYKMHDSWQIYQPISISGAVAYFNMPESEDILLAFKNGAEEWKNRELKNDVLTPGIQFVMMEEDEDEIQVVIKGNPLSQKSLNDILAIGNNAVAVVPSGVREEVAEKDPDAKSGDGDGDGDDDFVFDFDDDVLIEDLIPLDYAIATLQTDVSVKQSDNTESTETAQTAITPEEESFEFESVETIFNTDAIKSVAMAEPEPVKPAAVVAQPEQTIQTTPAEPVVSDDYTFETTDTLLEELEAAVAEAEIESEVETETEVKAETSSSSTAKRIAIISSVTITAAMAASLIIFGKKKKREEESV